MFCFSFCILVIGVPMAFGQTNKFEYECDILSRLDYLEKELKEAKNKLEDKIHGGSTYVRWGRTTCPGNGTELVYSGLAGGSFWTHTGASVNFLCLPKEPKYGEYYEDAEQDGALVFGAEYKLGPRTNRMKFFPDLADRTELYNNDVPCAVCRTLRSTVLMVPAQNMCMDGWTLEYKGLLVGEKFIHNAAGEYMCLDDQPEYIAGGGAARNGKLLFLTEGRCGVLPCPPYVNGRELTCSVCTK